MDTALFAEILNESIMYKISNVDYIYDKNPKEFQDAKPFKDMTWDEYFELFNIQEDSSHVPNDNIPIDVECARFCNKKEISLFLAGGSRIEKVNSLEDILLEGTLVHP